MPARPPPWFLGNALLLAAVRELEARGDLRVVPPDSPLLKKGRLLGQVGAQGGEVVRVSPYRHIRFSLYRHSRLQYRTWRGGPVSRRAGLARW